MCRIAENRVAQETSSTAAEPGRESQGSGEQAAARPGEVDIPMGFSTQSNLWQCGPYALMHALISLGVLVNEKEISRLAGTDASGTDELELARAAKEFGCKLRTVRHSDPDRARRALVRQLRRGIPCLLCIHQWRHWVAVVKEERGRFILLDSEEKAVLTIVSSEELSRLWGYHQKDEVSRNGNGSLYDLHPLVPRFRVRLRARFSISRARFLRRPENRGLARQWDKYLEDLLVLCRPANRLAVDVISLGEFLRRHGGMIVDQVAFWHGSIARAQAEKVLRNMRFVAATHGLVIPPNDVERVIAGLTAILTLWAGGKFGVSPIYEARKPRRKSK